MAPDPGHRASDADREAVSGLVRDAAAEGRIGLDELDERLSAVWTARTYGELARTTADLPVNLPAVLSGSGPPALRPATGTTRLAAVGGPGTGHAIAVFSGCERKGNWTVPATLNAVAVFGGVELDLREATLTARETVIHVFAMFGGIEITVGEDVELVVSGAGILGGFQGAGSAGSGAGAPVVRVVGAAIFGGVEVRRRPPRKALRGTGRGPRALDGGDLSGRSGEASGYSERAGD